MRIKNKRKERESQFGVTWVVPPMPCSNYEAHLLDTLLALSFNKLCSSQLSSNLTALQQTCLLSTLFFPLSIGISLRTLLLDLLFLSLNSRFYTKISFVIPATSHIQALKSISTLHTYVSSLLIFQQHYIAAKLAVPS